MTGVTEPDAVTFDIARIASVRHVLHGLLRTAAATGFAMAGFAGLAILYDAERGGLGKLQVAETARFDALIAAWACMQPLWLASMLIEFVLPLLLYARVSWRTILWLLPAAWAAVGGWMAFRVFALVEVESLHKATMIALGGGLAFFLASSLQASLWQATADKDANENDFPRTWYLTLVMLGASFFGAHRGWTGIGPHFKQVMDYRTHAWPADRVVDPGKPAAENGVQ